MPSLKPPDPDLGNKLANGMPLVEPLVAVNLDDPKTWTIREQPKPTPVAPPMPVFLPPPNDARVGQHVFYWITLPPFGLVKVPAQLHSKLPVIDGHPNSGWWNIGIHFQPGQWIAGRAVAFSDVPKENHWTVE